MPRSVLRPPAVRVVASRAMDVLWWLLEGGFTAPKALKKIGLRAVPRQSSASG